ncbi:MAG: hypothetical protein JOZ31_18765 [Verrucomicrobia bacterium]|nr:hypothetical protein [Verrucomicrobiota bacterium]
MVNATYPTARQFAVGNRLIAVWNTAVGKKLVMAVTGAMMGLFVIAHMIGNPKIFVGANENRRII